MLKVIFGMTGVISSLWPMAWQTGIAHRSSAEDLSTPEEQRRIGRVSVDAHFGWVVVCALFRRSTRPASAPGIGGGVSGATEVKPDKTLATQSKGTPS